MTQVKQNRKQVHEELMKKLFVQNHPYANLEPEGIIFKKSAWFFLLQIIIHVSYYMTHILISRVKMG